MLKADDSTKDIPVILLSAKGRNVDQKVGFEVGADDYITKPFSPRKLVERINAILGQTEPAAACRPQPPDALDVPRRALRASTAGARPARVALASGHCSPRSIWIVHRRSRTPARAR